MAYVGAEGPRHATVAIVGEKPNREDVQQNRPFVGASGRELTSLLLQSGVSRSAIYITNAVKKVNNFDTPTNLEIQAEQLTLYKELASLPNLAVIIPMGSAALKSLTNFQLDSIGSYRGSILPSFIGIKMVPTYHPAFYMRGEWRFKPIVRFDIQRALEESTSKTIPKPSRSYCIAETRQDLLHMWEELSNRVEYISFDIELMRGRYIECIAFAKTPNVAYCIPLTDGRRKPYWIHPEDEAYAWKIINAILTQDKIAYVAKNGLFDCWHLWRHGITVPMDNGYDPEYMHRLRAPDLPHDLGFLVSIYTKEPYYKDESGDWTLQNRTIPDEQFYIYNCKDALTTLEVLYELRDDMEQWGMLDYYKQRVQRQWSAVMDMRCRGLHIDAAAVRNVRTIIQTDIAELTAKLERVAGWKLNTKSSLEMTKFYNNLKVNYDKTTTGKPRLDAERVYTYAARYPQYRDIFHNIAELNTKRTLQSGFLNLVTDQNNYYHPALTITKTVTGRLASKGSDDGGPQIQNIPKSLRHIVIPDDPITDELVNADLKGAEAMLLAYFTQDPLLLGAFLQKKDIHRVRACVIFRNWTSTELPSDEMLATIKIVCDKCAADGQKECNHSERYLGKQGGHAMAYKEGVRRFCQELRKRGIFIDEAMGKTIKDKVVSLHISQWHKDVESSLRLKSWLVNPLGRKREFYGLLDEDMLRAALSWLCQSTVGDITNAAMVALHHEFQTNPNLQRCRLITQTHDSVTITSPKTARAYLTSALNNAFNQPLLIHSRKLLIPIDITSGPNWRDLK